MSSPSSLLEGLTYSDEGADFSRRLDTGEIVTISARDIRRERTGIHAVVAVMLNQHVTEHDNFNISRSEERVRLARLAHKVFGSLAQQAYPLEALRLDLGAALLAIAQEFEEAAHTIDRFDVQETFPPLRFVLAPYLLEGGGTVIFAPPGAGKSYLCMAMAACIASGVSEPWPVLQQPCLYINLERSRQSLGVREQAIRRALKIKDASGVSYVHARGTPLRALATIVRGYVREKPDAVLFLDSISRTGLGDLNSNETANALVDLMNKLGQTWLGIAHTPRASTDHAYGSVHLDAGEDIGIKVLSEQRDDMLGLSLTVTKANDTPKPRVAYYALEFGENGLEAIRDARAAEFPGLLLGENPSLEQGIRVFLQEHGQGTATEIANATHLNRTNVSSLLNKSKEYVRLPKHGSEQPFGLAYHEEP